MENCKKFTQKEISSGLEKDINICEQTKIKKREHKEYVKKMTSLLNDEITSQRITQEIITAVYQWMLFHPDASDEEILNKQDDIMIETINKGNLSNSVADKIIRKLEYRE